MEKREFYIDTPLGKLKVWAKSAADHPEDFPGVYIDIVRDGKDDELLACVEYESVCGEIQTCVYDIGIDVPQIVHTHDLTEG